MQIFSYLCSVNKGHNNNQNIKIMNTQNTYDVVFQDDNASNSKGWQETFEYCKNYIESNNGTNNSYFADYKGGTVSIYCNETGEEVYTWQCK